MAYKIPGAAGHLKKNRFHFELGDETLSLPKLDFVPASADEFMRDRAPDMTRTEFVLAFIEHCDAEVGARVRAAKLSRDQVYALQEEWSRVSEVDTGE